MRLTKKWIAFTFTALITTNIYAADTGAATTSGAPGAGGDANALLKQIASNTYHMLEAINNVPNYLDSITQQAISWLAIEDKDDSYIVKTQGDFANLGSLLAQANTNQKNAQTQVAANFLNVDAKNLTTPTKSPKILETLPFINDITYASLIGAPPVPQASFNPSDYLSNSLGSSIPHITPSNNWPGKPLNKLIYSGYYKSIMAANSFGAYVLSGLIAENQNGNKLTALHDKLITEASESSWLAQIATEELGKVLRDILLFQSQNYVLMTKSIELQKQQLTAQVLTNSLLVSTNTLSEVTMFQKATTPG